MAFIGSSDSSVDVLDNDLFEISQYVKGLTQYILKCVTPMTLSFQGDWGSGKTSMMNMVKDELGERVVPVWFNTWQYSQFNFGDDLALSLLGRLIRELKIKEDTSPISKTFGLAFKAIKRATALAVDTVSGSSLGSELESMATKFANGEYDVVDAINNLKRDFQELVNKKLSASSGKDRVVIFIDDLDRLNPGKAVELLEVLKVFLDCENCVFVLAIDYSVVSQGVKEKYGNLIGEDKGKSFFDKIIQVPFKMPVAHYKVDRFVIEMFKQVEIDLSENSKKTELYTSLIRFSVGCNPRTMKRLFNAYLLLSEVSEFIDVSVYLKDPKLGDWYKQMLFGVLCCQQSFEDLYSFLIRHHNSLSVTVLINELANIENYYGDEDDEQQTQEEALEDNEEFDSNDVSSSEVAELIAQELGKNSDSVKQRMVDFMKLIAKTVDRDGNGDFDEEESKGFSNLLNFTTITAANNNAESQSEDPRTAKMRQVYRDLMAHFENHPLTKDLPREYLNIEQRINEYYSRKKTEKNFQLVLPQICYEIKRIGDVRILLFVQTDWFMYYGVRFVNDTWGSPLTDEQKNILTKAFDNPNWEARINDHKYGHFYAWGRYLPKLKKELNFKKCDRLVRKLNNEIDYRQIMNDMYKEIDDNLESILRTGMPNDPSLIQTWQ